MPLKIIDDGQRQEFQQAGSVIYYTVLPWGKLQEARNAVRDSNQLLVDQHALNEEILKRHVIGWEGVLDQEDKPVPFSHDALLKLPALIIDALLTSIWSVTMEEAEAQGESESSSTTWRPTRVTGSRSWTRWIGKPGRRDTRVIGRSTSRTGRSGAGRGRFLPRTTGSCAWLSSGGCSMTSIGQRRSRVSSSHGVVRRGA